MKTPRVNDNCPASAPDAVRLSCWTTVALFGATAIVAQVLLLRECLVVVAGNELFIALFFGCWFLGIAAGAAVGSYLRVRRRRLLSCVALFLLLQVVLLPCLIVSLRDVRARWDLPVSQFAPFFPLLGIALLHLCPFSLLTGLTFPMLCRLLATDPGGNKRAIGSVYTVESLGSLLGGAVVTFVFAVYCEPLTGAWVLGALTASNLTWLLFNTESRGGRVTALVTTLWALGFLGILLSPARRGIEHWSAALRHRAYDPGFQWLAERYTPYQHLALVRQQVDPDTDAYQYSLLSNGRFVESFPDPYAISQRVQVMMSQCKGRTSRVLVIGGGEGGALRSLLLYPDTDIDYVEIDPAVLETVRPYLEEPDRRAFSDHRVRIFHEDARRFIRRRLRDVRGPKSPGPYDAILCNAPDPATAALNRFYTRDFFRETRALLKPSGVFVTSISSGVNYFSADLLNYVGSVYQALHGAFGHVLATPGTQAYLFATADDDLLTSDVERLIGRFEQRGVEDPVFSPLSFHTAYETEQLNRVNRSLRRSLGSVPPNSDAEPVTYLYHLRLWNLFAGGRSQSFFDLIQRYDWRWVVLACALCLLLRAAAFHWIPMSSDRAAYRQSVAVLFLTGIAGMVSSILLLLLFQNFHGHLYRDVGLLVALFMAGLTLGGLTGNRTGRTEKRWLVGGISRFALAYGLFFLVMEGLVHARGRGGQWGELFDHAAFFYGAMIAAGCLTGVQFSLVGRLASVAGRDPGRAGGALECLDHVGACLGAFLTGIILIPVSGIEATLLTLACVEAGAGLWLMVSGLGLRPNTRAKDERRKNNAE